MINKERLNIMELLILSVVSLLFMVGVYFYTKNKYSKLCVTEPNKILSEILEVNFKNNNISSAAESILSILKNFYKVEYITIFLYSKEHQNFKVISSNVETVFLPNLESYANKIIHELKDNEALILEADRTALSYETAIRRRIMFSNFTPLEFNKEIIGAVLLESTNSNELATQIKRKDLYDKIFKDTTLVLQNVINTEDLIKSVSTDQLTGIYNRRFIDRTLEEELNIHEKLGLSFNVALMDIDKFKKFNDTYGHQFGDITLKQVAAYIKNNIGCDAWIGRYGGEEFLLFYARSNIEEVFARVDKLRKGIEQLIISDGNIESKVTASFGIASFPEHAITITELIHLADKGLYKSKADGRNKVTIYQEGENDGIY
jgi:diguanylate cyclase (GGDEF)-like protein